MIWGAPCPWDPGVPILVSCGAFHFWAGSWGQGSNSLVRPSSSLGVKPIPSIMALYLEASEGRTGVGDRLLECG